MPEPLSERELLEQIRDLLVPFSAVYRPQFAELVRSQRKEQVEDIMDTVGQGAKNVGAAKLMDGSLTRKQISEASKIDSGALSRVLKALKEKELVHEEDGRPNLVVEPAIIWSD